jgi:hypothetical protein
MPQIGQSASDSRVSPRRIFKRHLQNEIDDRFGFTPETTTIEILSGNFFSDGGK